MHSNLPITLIPREWSQIADYDGNFIYANEAGTHTVNKLHGKM